MNSDDNCVRSAGGVDHGQSGKARARRLDQAPASTVDFTHRDAVHQHRHRQHAAGDPDRHGRELGAGGTVNVDPRAVQWKLDVRRLLTAGPDQFPRRTKSPQRQREFCIAHHQRTCRRLRQGR